MYDVDGNGYIDMQEMTRLVSSIYKMVAGATTIQLEDTPEERAREIFTKMDVNSDGKVTREEFTKTCLNDRDLMNLLAPKYHFINFFLQIFQFFSVCDTFLSLFLPENMPGQKICEN